MRLDVEGFVVEFMSNVLVEADETTFLGGGEQSWRRSAPGKLRFVCIWRKRSLVGLYSWI